jgi:hypothetical protein
MKGSVAASLIVIALVVGAGIGYLGSASKLIVTTETIIKTYTTATTYTTTTTPPQLSGAEQCVVTEYHVWIVEIYPTNVTSTTTQSYGVRTYQTSNSVEQNVGFETTVATVGYTGTLTGAIDIWNSTVCTYIPS